MNAAVEPRIRTELARDLVWPSSLLRLTRPLEDLGATMDLGKLADLAATIHKGNELSFSIVSKEYLQVGLNWANAMRKLGLNNFLIIAGDKFTAQTFSDRGIPNIVANVDESEFDASYVSSTGFSAKGLAVSAFKFPVAKFLVESGYSVVMSDADAVWLQDPMPLLRGPDLAFQRIVYHPPSIARLWGFAACGGFLSFRRGEKAASFLDQCIQQHQSLFCDQVAINLALLDSDPVWHCDDHNWVLPVEGDENNRANLEIAFRDLAKVPITGDLRRGELQVLALPHDKFWRHALVTTPLRDMVICHPNSPKDDIEKMALFDKMGLRFELEIRHSA